jgi:uncharacterized membrane protein
MKYIITESQYNNTIDKFISSQFEPHEKKTIQRYPTSIFWVKNGEIIAEIENSEYFTVKNKVWYIISVMFSLGYDETQKAISLWLEEHYNLGELIPSTIEDFFSIQLDEHHNFGRLNN